MLRDDKGRFVKGCKMPKYMIIKSSVARVGKPSGMLGKNQSKESRRKMSENSAKYWLGKKRNLADRKKMSVARKKNYSEDGMVSWNKGMKGFLAGRVSPMKGRKHTLKTRKKMSNSNPYKGRTIPHFKGRISPMKGKYLSVETRDKIRQKLTGRKLSKDTCLKMSITRKGQVPWNKGKRIWDTRVHPMKGKTHTLGARLRISKNNKGKIISQKQRNEIAKSLRGRKRPDDVVKKMSLAMSGSNHPRWKNGLSVCKYTFGWNEHLKEKIRISTERCCVITLQKENGKKLHVHHIDCNKNNHSPENLIPLLPEIHMQLHANEEFWEGTPYLNRRGGEE